MAIYKKDLLNKLRAYATTPDDETTQYKEKIKQALMKSPELLYALHEEELETELYCEDENRNLVLNIDEEIPAYKLFKEEVITANNPIPLIVALIIYLLVFIANAYGFLLLYRIIEKFKKLQLFEVKIISYLKRIVYIFSVGYLLIYFLKPIVSIDDCLFFKKSTNGYETFISNPLNGLVIGLFFLVLSKVFQIAKKQKEENIELKQENELTI